MKSYTIGAAERFRAPRNVPKARQNIIYWPCQAMLMSNKFSTSESIMIHRPCRANLNSNKLTQNQTYTIHCLCQAIMSAQGRPESAKTTLETTNVTIHWPCQANLSSKELPKDGNSRSMGPANVQELPKSQNIGLAIQL